MGYTDFHRYARERNVVKIRKYVKQKSFDLYLHTDDNSTAFALSVHDDNLEVVNILLELGPNVNNADHENDTPLHYPVANGNLEMVAKLIEHGADVCARNDYQITPVWIAAYRKYPTILKLLLFNFADPMVCSSGAFHVSACAPLYEKQVSPLYVAVARNFTECVTVLLKAGYEIHKEKWLLEGDYPPDYKNLRCACDPKYQYIMRTTYGNEESELMCANEESKVQENIALLNELLSRPPNLLCLCRAFIRKRIGRRLLECVSALGLPKHLESYLTLADFKTNLASLRSCQFKFDGSFKRFCISNVFRSPRINTSLSDKYPSW